MGYRLRPRQSEPFLIAGNTVGLCLGERRMLLHVLRCMLYGEGYAMRGSEARENREGEGDGILGAEQKGHGRGYAP